MPGKPTEYKYGFSDLGIHAGRLEKLMGFDAGGSPEPIPELIHNLLKQAPVFTEVSGGFVYLDPFSTAERNDRIRVGELEFLTGTTITEKINTSDRLALFVITAGKDIEIWSHSLTGKGDPLAGYIVDMLGSEIVESAMDRMQDTLEMESGKQDLKITNRYSPGHCGWPVSDQGKLFSFFPRNFCGISLNDSCLMDPIKSLSGIIGIGENVSKQAYGCQICDVKNCLYRGQRV